jgi:hypothetical protein
LAGCPPTSEPPASHALRFERRASAFCPRASPAACPGHLQEAFNLAFERHYGDDAVAFRIAWAAVKAQYEKVDGEWLPRS